MKRYFQVFLLFLLALYSVAHAGAEEGSAQHHYEQGFEMLKEKRLEEALVHFKKAAEMMPDVPQIYYAIGLVHFGLQKNVYDAIDAFDTALSINPKMADAHYHLGVIYGGLVPDVARAEQHLMEAVAADPGHAAAQFALGWLRITRNRDAKGAVEPLEKAAELNPSHTDAQYYLALAYILSGEKHRALKPISMLKFSGQETLSRGLEAMTDIDSSVAKERLLEGSNPEEEVQEAGPPSLFESSF